MKLEQVGLLGMARLSCQIIFEHDLSLTPLRPAENQPEWEGDTGPAPASVGPPEADWYPIEDLQETLMI